MTGAGEITCRELVELVTAYLEDALPGGERARFEAHLAVCKGCRDYLRQIEQVASTAGRLHEEDLEPGARDALLAAFRGWKRGG
jgi:predicted anti-sigma-YlaC factor YlaD